MFSDRGGEILKEGIGFHFSEDVLFCLCGEMLITLLKIKSEHFNA